ncbi:MAG: hypothetical protein QM783_16780 [Phycisphaerales bacterium]
MAFPSRGSGVMLLVVSADLGQVDRARDVVEQAGGPCGEHDGVAELDPRQVGRQRA